MRHSPQLLDLDLSTGGNSYSHSVFICFEVSVLQATTHKKRAITMNKENQQSDFSSTPRPVRAEWERTIASLRPYLSPEKFQEAEKVHWRMFDRANSWFELGALRRGRENRR